MTGMSRIRYAVAAAVLVSTLWAQNDDHPTSNSAAAESSTQSKPGAAALAPASIPADSTKLEPIKIVKAVYPPEAKVQKLEGRVIIKINVTESGYVDGAEVVSGNPILAAACVDAAKEWKFKPFIRDGKPKRVSANLPFDFKPSTDAPLLVPIEDLSSRGAESVKSPADNPTASNPGSKSPSTTPDSASLVLIRKVKATYPIEAENQEIQGEVVVKISVSEVGDVDSAEILSGNPILARASVDAVKKWKFRPFFRNGARQSLNRFKF
jgi:TonB family protein